MSLNTKAKTEIAGHVIIIHIAKPDCSALMVNGLNLRVSHVRTVKDWQRISGSYTGKQVFEKKD